MNEEIKDAAITLLQTLINATGAEPEDERLAIQIIAKTMQEVVNENDLLQRVSVSDSDIDAMFPYEDIETARPTRPENRTRAYNSRQADRREGAKRLLVKLHSR